MRYKNKIYCDCCGKFLRVLDKKEMEKIKNTRDIGFRTNCAFVCDSCSKKNEKELKNKIELEKKI